MIDSGVVSGPELAGWSVGLAFAALAVWLRAREGRRRGALNRALHELRRPLQVLALTASSGSTPRSSASSGDRGRAERESYRVQGLELIEPAPVGGSSVGGGASRRPTVDTRPGGIAGGRIRIATGKLDGADGVPPSLDVLEQALAAVADLDRTVNGGTTPPRPAPMGLRAPIERLVVRWQALLIPADLRLQWLAIEEDACVEADPARLRQALENLIANAHEHGRSPITVSVSTPPGVVRIAVADAGPAPLLTSRWARDRRRGHGLAVAVDFAAAHGGALRVWPRSAGGTVAAVDLPAPALGESTLMPVPRSRLRPRLGAGVRVDAGPGTGVGAEAGTGTTAGVRGDVRTRAGFGSRAGRRAVAESRLGSQGPGPRIG